MKIESIEQNYIDFVLGGRVIHKIHCNEDRLNSILAVDFIKLDDDIYKYKKKTVEQLNDYDYLFIIEVVEGEENE